MPASGFVKRQCRSKTLGRSRNEAGYAGKGSRVDRTWRERIDILKKLGFIKTARKGLDECAYILLIDPHIATLKLIDNQVLSTTDRKVFEEWFETFELVCEQWGTT